MTTITMPRPRPTHRHHRRARGFTLVELLVTVAIVVILATLAVPSFYVMQQDNRVAAQVNGLQGLIHNARSSAVREQRPSRVCPLGGDWSSGAFSTMAPECNALPGNQALRVFEADAGLALEVAWPGDGLRFSASGQLETPAAERVVIVASPSPRVTPRRLELATSGASRVTREASS